MTSYSQVSKTYASMQISTSSNPSNTCMLHTRCIYFLKQALLSEQPARRLLIDKAQNILAELEHALIIEDDLSRGLFYIYDYCYILLEQPDSGKLLSAISLITHLRDTFAELLKAV